VLDCKGGRDARVKAERTRRLLYGAGARRVAIWPDEARLSIWDLPPADLAGVLELVGAFTWQLPARIRYGRPLRLVIRRVVVALACLGVLALIPGQPAAPPLVAAMITWFLVTGRSDLAPPWRR
jgi:hypothetical protein